VSHEMMACSVTSVMTVWQFRRTPQTMSYDALGFGRASLIPDSFKIHKSTCTLLGSSQKVSAALPNHVISVSCCTMAGHGEDSCLDQMAIPESRPVSAMSDVIPIQYLPQAIKRGCTKPPGSIAIDGNCHLPAITFSESDFPGVRVSSPRTSNIYLSWENSAVWISTD